MTSNEEPQPASDPTTPIPIDTAKLREQGPELKRALERLLENAKAEMPADYDIEAAFADVLSLAAVPTNPITEPAIVRVALFLYERLPGSRP